MCETLEKLGHTVEGASSGARARALIDAEPFDLVLSDLRMPGMDGPELYETACARRPHLRDRFVFVTGDALTEKVARFLEEVKLPHLTKPFDMDRVRTVVSEFAPIEPTLRTAAGSESS